MRCGRPVALAALFLLATIGSAQEEDTRPICHVAVDDFALARSRIEQRVEAEGLLRNLTEEPLADVVMSVQLFDYKGEEVLEFPPLRISEVAPRRSVRLDTAATRVVVFEAYKMHLTYTLGGRQCGPFHFDGPDVRQRPRLLDGRPFGAKAQRRLQVGAVQESGRGTTPEGEFLIWLTNTSEGPLSPATLRLAGAFLPGGEACMVDLPGGNLEPGATRGYALTLPGSPQPLEVDARPVILRERVELPGGDILGAPELEIGEFRFDQYSDGSLRVRTRVRNGESGPFANLRLTVQLLDDRDSEVARVEYLLPGRLEPGADVTLERVAARAPVVASYAYDVQFDPPEKAREPYQPPSVIPVRIVPPEGDATLPPAPRAIASRAHRIALLGIDALEGTFVRSEGGKRKGVRYTGDVLFLKVAFQDAGGNPVEQDGTFEFSVTSKGRRLASGVERRIDGADFRRDIRKLERHNAEPTTCGYDPQERIFWLGLARVPDKEGAAPWALSITFHAREGEVWTWEPLPDPFLEGPRSPDAPRPEK